MSLYLTSLYSFVSLSNTLNLLPSFTSNNSFILLLTNLASKEMASTASSSSSDSCSSSSTISSASLPDLSMIWSSILPPTSESSSWFSRKVAPKCNASSSVYSNSPTTLDITILNIKLTPLKTSSLLLKFL